MNKHISLTLLALEVIFLLILGQFFVPPIRDFFKGSEFFLLSFILFSLLGGFLIFLTLKRKRGEPLNKFLMITGISAVGVFVGIFLHNFFYALGTLKASNVFLGILKNIFNILSVIFFFTPWLCLLGFLAGMVGVAVVLKREKTQPL